MSEIQKLLPVGSRFTFNVRPPARMHLGRHSGLYEAIDHGCQLDVLGEMMKFVVARQGLYDKIVWFIDADIPSIAPLIEELEPKRGAQ